VNQKWSADISYIWTREEWLYLAIVRDLFSWRIIGEADLKVPPAIGRWKVSGGWSVSDRLHRNLALAALRQAVAIRRPAQLSDNPLDCWNLALLRRRRD
jgi:putative transposase